MDIYNTAYPDNQHGPWSSEINGIRQSIKTSNGKVRAVDQKADLWLRIYDQYASAPVALRTSFKFAKLEWHSDSRTSQGTEDPARAEQLLLYISYRNKRTCAFPLRVNFAGILVRCLVITA